MPATPTKVPLNKLFLSVDNRKEHIQNLFTSALYFAVTFIALHYLGHAWSTHNAHHYGYTPLFSYNGMDTLLGTSGWTARKIGIIHLMPPFIGVVSLFLGLLLLQLIRTKRIHLRTFLFWLSVNGLLIYASYISTGFLSGLNYSSKFFTGFVGYYAWLYWKPINIYGMLFMQALLCLPVLFYLSRFALGLNYSSSLLKQDKGRVIIWANVVLIPFVLGSMIVVLATFPMDFGYQLVRFATFIPMALAMLASMHFFSTRNIGIIKGGLKGFPIILFVAALVMIVVISRTVLSVSSGPLW